ncbi:MAG: ATP-binding cassette domain-containing protein [Planctomycetota bacterium]
MTRLPGAASWRFAWQLAAAGGGRRLAALLVLAVVQALLPLAGLVALQRLIDAVARGVAGRQPDDQALADATTAVLVAAAVAFLGSALRSLATVVSENHGRELGDAATRRVQAHAAEVPQAAFDQPGFHDLLLRAGAEAGQRPVRLVQDGIAAVVAVVGLVTMVVVLFRVSWWLPGMVAATALPLAVVRRRHADQRVRWQERHTGDQRDVGYAGAVLAGRASSKEVRSLGLRTFWLARLDRLRAGLRASLAALARQRARDELVVQTVASAGLFVAYYVLAKDALAGGLTLGGLVLQAQAAQRAQNGVRDALAALAGVHEHRLFLRPVADLLALPPAGANSPNATPPPGPFAVEVADLRFAYAESRQPALAGVSFALRSGERVAITGANGSGKSTLVKLLCGLYAPTGGTIRVHGGDLAAVAPATWSDRVAVLLQDAQVYELSVRDNLRFDRAGDESALWAALATVGLEARVRALPEGLATMCSRRHPGGVEWSAGEARRLLLARALVRPADLIVLDEPFDGVDPATAAQVAAALRVHRPQAILLVVDHRPEALHVADRVLTLANGRVVADRPVRSA